MVVAYRYRRRLPETGKIISGALEQLKTLRLKELTEDWRRLVYILTIASFGILALTGFVPVVFFGKSVSGFVLILHALAAPIFAIGLAIICFLWAHHHRFNNNDWQSLLHFTRRKTENIESVPQPTALGRKISFWLILLLSLTVIGSVILSMYPLFSTDGQEMLLRLHGYSALFLLIVVVTRFYLLRLTQKADSDRD